MSVAKKHFLLRVMVSVLFGIGVGVLLLVLAPYGRELFDILVIAIGVFTLFINLPPLVIACWHIKRHAAWIGFTVSLISCLLGTGFIFLTDSFLPWLFLLYAVALPIARVGLAGKRKHQFKRELVHFAVGGFMLLVFYSRSESYILRYGGIAALVLAGIYLVFGILSLRFWRENEKG